MLYSSRRLMESERIARLLRPFLAAPLAQSQLEDISMYIDMLLKWNQRTNLTAVRDPDQIVTRHFGEALFAARHLFPSASGEDSRVVDVGSGAGFPGLPLAIWCAGLSLTLIESNNKKATFLREVVRRLQLPGVEVFAGRAEEFPAASAQVVTMRAVERFESALAVAAKLVSPGGRMALLIGHDQASRARELLSEFQWRAAVPIPSSVTRVLLLGSRGSFPEMRT